MSGDAAGGERAGERGFVLLSVLGIVLVFVMVSAGVASRSHLAAMQDANRAQTARLGLVVDGAARLAAFDLAAAAPTLATDGTPLSCALGGLGTVSVAVQDQDGLLDLNGAPPAMITAVLEAWGMPADTARRLAAEIVDFRDADDMPQPLFGAERFEYGRAGLAWGPRNGYFADASEFSQLPSATPQLVGELAPLLTVFNPRTAISLDVADALVNGRMGERSKALAAWLAPSRRARFTIVVRGRLGTRASFAREAAVQVDRENRAFATLKWARRAAGAEAAPAAAGGGAPFCQALAAAFGA